MLGLIVDLGDSGKGQVTVSNKPERVQNIAEGLCAILNRQAMLASEASSLQGQLNFVQGQLYGCTLKPAMAYLSEISNRGWRASDLELLPMMVTYVLTTLRTAPPRTLSVCDVETPVLLSSQMAPTSRSQAATCQKLALCLSTKCGGSKSYRRWLSLNA